MDDALSRLARAIARIGEELRARRKKKRPQKPSGPRPSGPNANKGCGTGAGGFGAGNSCAKEDGRPNAPTSPVMRPVNAKADMAKAKAMKEKAAKKQAAKIAADKARAEAYRPIKEAKAAAKSKQKRIEKLRKAAAERKAAKGERDAAEMKAAAEAAAAKRAAMLQKIRVKKANEQIKIVEKPAGKFSGEVDSAVQKNAGETQVSFAKRRIEADIKRLHKELDDLDARADAAALTLAEKVVAKQAECNIRFSALRKHQEEWLKSGASSPSAQQTKEQLALRQAYDKAKSERESLHREQDMLETRHRDEAHDIIAEFVQAHAGGTVKIDADAQFADPALLASTSSQFKDAFMRNSRDAWGFLGRVAAPIHQQKAAGVRIRLDTKNGDADYTEIGGGAGIARHGVYGDGSYNTSARVIVHEIAHGLHYGMPPKSVSPQDGVEWLQSPQYRVRKAIKEDYDERVAKLRADNQGDVENVVYDSRRENYRLWIPKGQPRKPRGESYLGYVNQYCDAENGNPTGATEVISCGVEHMYAEQRMFRKKHRSHFDLTLLFLAGRLH